MTEVIATVALDGSAMSFAVMSAIGSGTSLVVADPHGLERCRAGRAALEAAINAGVPVYGATTGVGAMKDVAIGLDAVDRFQAGLVRAHHFGVGEPLSASVVRVAMAIRVNTALTGHVGCSPALVQACLRLLAADVVPVVRRVGSIGAADIGLMGQIGSVVAGAGEAFWSGQRMPAAEALAAACIEPLSLAAKDSLSVVSTNAVAIAAAAAALGRAAAAVRVLLATGLAAAAMMGASRDPWEAAVRIGGAPEAMVAEWLMREAETTTWSNATRLQGPLSLRMMPQVFGAVAAALLHAGAAVVEATARPDDNPVVIDGRVLTSGGSLPLVTALAVQGVGAALAHAARNAFNRCVLLGNGGPRGLPVNLVQAESVATGFGPILKLAGDLYARVLAESAPVSAYGMVVAGGIEDEATFLPLAVERLERQVDALRSLAAVEALLAAQAADLLGETPGGVVGDVLRRVRIEAAFYSEDRPQSNDVEAVEWQLASADTITDLACLAPLPALDAYFALGTTRMKGALPQMTSARNL
jgi:histidine ammonia-lyase